MENKILGFNPPTKDGFNSNHRKERYFWRQYSVISSELKEIVCVRFYQTNARLYCCFWINEKGINGTGYCLNFNRISAFADALSNAGFILDNFSIIGGGSFESLLDAVVKFNFPKVNYKIFIANP